MTVTASTASIEPAKLTDKVYGACLLPAGSALYFRSTGAVPGRTVPPRHSLADRAAVRRESSNYWYQYFLAYIEDKNR